MKKYIDDIFALGKIGEQDKSSFFECRMYIDVENQIRFLKKDKNNHFGEFPLDYKLASVISLDFYLFSNRFCGYRIKTFRDNDEYRYEDLAYSEHLNGDMIYYNGKRQDIKEITKADSQQLFAYYGNRRLLEYLFNKLKNEYGIDDLPYKKKFLDSYSRGLKWYE